MKQGGRLLTIANQRASVAEEHTREPGVVEQHERGDRLVLLPQGGLQSVPADGGVRGGRNEYRQAVGRQAKVQLGGPRGFGRRPAADIVRDAEATRSALLLGCITSCWID